MKKTNRTYRIAFSRDGVKDYQQCFDYDEFMDLFEILIGKIYIGFGDNVFKQVVSIPMGTNCAPLLAKLYLLTMNKFRMNISINQKLPRSII